MGGLRNKELAGHLPERPQRVVSRFGLGWAGGRSGLLPHSDLASAQVIGQRAGRAGLGEGSLGEPKPWG